MNRYDLQDGTAVVTGGRLADELVGAHGRIDVLVASAGIAGPNAPVTEYPL